MEGVVGKLSEVEVGETIDEGIVVSELNSVIVAVIGDGDGDDAVGVVAGMTK